jgi:hypothetical protein
MKLEVIHDPPIKLFRNNCRHNYTYIRTNLNILLLQYIKHAFKYADRYMYTLNILKNPDNDLDLECHIQMV